MYQVIARKYRPQKFDDLIGQEHVQRTLANAIESGRLAHGYIFSGQRGTGKTTVARILARCLNCVQGPTAHPCGVCSSCLEIAAGNSVDVIEIDAASNRGINEMREIRENVRYRPARDRYKVFIIDEAHQITKEAFNALLKTLEEPPEWVVFILCTTEANEIPNTIASRCQHFVFRSVDFTELMERMRFIAREEGIDANDEALSVIAQAGEGSVRDSLSALDQAIACCGNVLSVQQVRALLGLFGTESLEAVSEAVKAGDGGRMLEIVADLENNGQSLHHFSRELSRFWRNLLVAKISGKPTRLITASDAEQTRMLEVAGDFREEDLTRFLSMSLALYKDLQYSLQPRLHLELGLVKLVHAGRMQPIEEALAQLGPAPGSESLPQAHFQEKERASGSAAPSNVTARTTVPRPPAFQAPASKPAPPSAPVPPAALAVNASDPPPFQEKETPHAAPPAPAVLKAELHQTLVDAGLNFSADAIVHAEVILSGGDLLIRAPKMMLMSLKEPAVEKLLLATLGRPVRFRYEAGASVAAAPVTSKSATSEKDDVFRRRALEHPGVKRFQELFPDSQVRAVRNLNE